MSYPRVTEILNYYTGYDNVPQDILMRAATRGQKVHSICAGLAKGAWLPNEMIDEHLHGYVDSFRKWSEAQVADYPIIETRMFDEELQYTGQLDFVIKGNDNELYLVDLKTSAKPQKTYPLQMAAYEGLLKKQNIMVKGAFLVYLQKDGEFPNINYLEDMTEEWRVFECALQCWKFFNKRRMKNAMSDV